MRLCTQPSSSEEAMCTCGTLNAHVRSKLLQDSFFFFFLRRPPAAYFERGLNVLNFSKVILLPLSCDEYISLHIFFLTYYISYEIYRSFLMIDPLHKMDLWIPSTNMNENLNKLR